jgi:hypothetical protein
VSNIPKRDRNCGTGFPLFEQQEKDDQQRLAILRSLASDTFDQIDQGRGIEIHGQQEFATFIDAIDQRVRVNVSRDSFGTC